MLNFLEFRTPAQYLYKLAVQTASKDKACSPTQNQMEWFS